MNGWGNEKKTSIDLFIFLHHSRIVFMITKGIFHIKKIKKKGLKPENWMKKKKKKKQKKKK